MVLLENYGWNDYFAQQWQVALAAGVPARVVADFGTSVRLATPAIVTAELSGKLAHYSNREHAPKVGDWVAVTITDNGNAVVTQTLTRRGEIARNVAGKRTRKQIIAANVDIAFVILAMDDDFSIERLQRFLYQLSVNHVEPVIVLNKADKTDDVDSFIQQIQSLQLPIIVTNGLTGDGVQDIIDYIRPAATAILLGSSGVGKSTLTNTLLGRQAQATQEVRESDSSGRHTTVHRELFMLPNGGMLIDSPGIRELQLWGTEQELDDKFADIYQLIAACKFASCKHRTDEGCAVRAALNDGTLDEEHFDRYKKMKKELVTLKKRNDANEKYKNKRSKKKLARSAKDVIRSERME